ncbi:MAG: hypothetical protein ACRDOA_18905 [Streptosporangiaceae bacterium]
MAKTTVATVTVEGIGAVPVTVTERGEGRPFLLLHGGAGPQSVDGFAELLATQEQARVPGSCSSPRPGTCPSSRRRTGCSRRSGTSPGRPERDTERHG